MKIVDVTTGIDPVQIDALVGGSGQEPRVESTVTAIIADIRERGDAALCDYSKKFDDFSLTAASMRVPAAEIRKYAEAADPEMIEVLRAAIRNVREFHVHQVEASWEFSAGDGVRLGVRNTAIGSVGLYIPGGKAAYPSSVLMNAIPAQVAGVHRIVVVTPPKCCRRIRSSRPLWIFCNGRGVPHWWSASRRRAGLWNTNCSARGQDCGTWKSIRAGGEAHGLRSGRHRHDCRTERGGHHRRRNLRSGVDCRGSSGSGGTRRNGRVWLICWSEEVAAAVFDEIQVQLQELDRSDIARAAINNHSVAFIVANEDAAITLANMLAAEHVEVLMAEPDHVADGIRNAGALFIGRYAPTSSVIISPDRATFFQPDAPHVFSPRSVCRIS
jgi:Histidinol dehydrogenase